MNRIPRGALIILAWMAAVIVLVFIVSCGQTRTALNGITGTPNGPVQLHETGSVTQDGFHGPCAELVTGKGQPLPDPSDTCTPGAFDPSITPASLCPTLAPSWDDERAPTSQTNKVKFGAIASAYHLTPQPGADELDHLIPRELGGTNSELNLWIEPGNIPNAKDAIENSLHRWVCSAASSDEASHRLRAAQIAIATNWTAARAQLGLAA